MTRYFSPIENNVSLASSSSNNVVSTEFHPDDIIIDPGLQKLIDDYNPNIRDQVRMLYLLKGPTQPHGHIFPRKVQGDRSRSFQEDWFSKFDWLESSLDKDDAYCFHCYLFKQYATDGKIWSDAFTKSGCTNWKNALQIFNDHIGGVNSHHNIARRLSENFNNQRQSISQVFSSHSNEQQIQYILWLGVVMDVIKYLLLQDLAFRRHDESSDSKNKENFLELLDWYANKCEDVARVLNENAPANNRMTSPQIQKDIVKACGEETIQMIMKEIGDRQFSVFIDESRDTSEYQQDISPYKMSDDWMNDMMICYIEKDFFRNVDKENILQHS